ncbi:MAG TPA: T9SS type A sorting domain-containing protein, partial [Flavobacteriales bacterium]|nr:T9SS type A sorting domain-containing protein [Flavobacteriales bacterium]
DSPFLLEISTDGGATWPTVILANEGLPRNQGAPGTNTPNATTETRRFSLYPYIADAPGNVRFRFHHNGQEAGSSHYYWQIDDVRIETLPEYEVRMNYAYTSTTGTGEEYGRIPISQFPPIMNIGAEVLNYGSAPQTNVSVQCIIRDASNTEVFEETILVGELATSASSVADAFVNLPGLGFGVYEATFTILSDQIDLDLDVTNNSLKRQFEISPEQYSIDALGMHPTGTEVQEQLGTSSFTNNATINVLTMYEITAATQAQSVTVILGSNSRAGSAATIEVFMLDTADVLGTPSNISSPINGIGSEPVSLTASNISDRGVTIPFEAPINLAPGAYYVCARISGSGTTTASDAEVFIADDNTVPQPGLSSMIYLPVDFNDDGTEGPHLYSNGNASAVRLNVSPIVSVDEVSTSPAITVFPNPTNGLLNIASDAQGVSIVEVIDLVGANVRTTSFKGSTVVDLSGLAQGLYNVRVSNGAHSKVERITLH